MNGQRKIKKRKEQKSQIPSFLKKYLLLLLIIWKKQGLATSDSAPPIQLNKLNFPPSTPWGWNHVVGVIVTVISRIQFMYLFRFEITLTPYLLGFPSHGFIF